MYQQLSLVVSQFQGTVDFNGLAGSKVICWIYCMQVNTCKGREPGNEANYYTCIMQTPDPIIITCVVVHNFAY